MEKIYFSLEDANKMLPYVNDVLKQLQGIKKDIVRIVQHIEEQGINFEELFAKQNLTEQEMQYRGKLEELGDQINSLIYDVQEKGAIIKDIEEGLVDFYAKIEGQDAFLCWKQGEGEIQNWHGAQEGFDGRKSLFERGILEEVAKVH